MHWDIALLLLKNTFWVKIWLTIQRFYDVLKWEYIKWEQYISVLVCVSIEWQSVYATALWEVIQTKDHIW